MGDISGRGKRTAKSGASDWPQIDERGGVGGLIPRGGRCALGGRGVSNCLAGARMRARGLTGRRNAALKYGA